MTAVRTAAARDAFVTGARVMLVLALGFTLAFIALWLAITTHAIGKGQSQNQCPRKSIAREVSVDLEAWPIGPRCTEQFLRPNSEGTPTGRDDSASRVQEPDQGPQLAATVLLGVLLVCTARQPPPVRTRIARGVAWMVLPACAIGVPFVVSGLADVIAAATLLPALLFATITGGAVLILARLR